MIEQGNYRVDFYDKDGKLITKSRGDIRSLNEAMEVAGQGIANAGGTISYQIVRCVFSSAEAG